MRKEALAAIVIILVVSSLGVGYLSGVSNTQTSNMASIFTTTETVERVATSSAASSGAVARNTTASSVSPIGIRLTTSINSTSLSPGQALNVTLSISNVLGTVNDIHTADDWPFQGVPVELWPFSYGTMPAQVVVLNGNFSADSLSLLARAEFQGVCVECSTPDHVVLQPNSDLANVTGVFCSLSCDNETVGPIGLERSFTTTGYWDPEYLANELNAPIIGNQNEAGPYSMPFLPGAYTVAVADEWGQVNVLHFQVVAESHPPDVVLEGFSLCSSDCYYPAPFLSGTVYFNSTSPARGFSLTVNGTYEGPIPLGYPIPFTNVPFVYKQTLTSPVVSGDAYTITFQFFFDNNTMAIASTTVVAR
jgi:hypothetical protein